MAINWDAPIEVRDLRNGDWFWISKYLWNDKRLSSSDKVVYGTVAFFANQQSQSAWPSLETMAKFSGVSARQIYRSIKNLLNCDYLFIKRGGGRGKSNEYQLLKINPDLVAPFLLNPDIVAKETLTQSTRNNNNNRTINNICNDQVVASKEVAVKEEESLEVVETSGKRINELITLFKPVNPSFERLFPNKGQRSALERMVEKHGEEKIRWVLERLSEFAKTPYAPVVTTPYQLEQKLGQVIIFLGRKANEKGGVVDARNIR